MLDSKTRSYIANWGADTETTSIADQFAEIMILISLDYDLEPDVWGAAQEVLQALRAKEEKSIEPTREVILAEVVSRAARPPWLFEQ